MSAPSAASGRSCSSTITARPKRKLFCEKCAEKAKVKRLIGSGSAVIFRSSGFYATDYREKPKKDDKK